MMIGCATPTSSADRHLLRQALVRQSQPRDFRPDRMNAHGHSRAIVLDRMRFFELLDAKCSILSLGLRVMKGAADVLYFLPVLISTRTGSGRHGFFHRELTHVRTFPLACPGTTE